MTDERKELNLCDENCNECPIIRHPNSRMVTRILNVLNDADSSGKVYEAVQDRCPNLTVCYDCRIDDFCHSGYCELKKGVQ